jgi:hypothetical protein
LAESAAGKQSNNSDPDVMTKVKRTIGDKTFNENECLLLLRQLNPAMKEADLRYLVDSAPRNNDTSIDCVRLMEWILA